MTKMSCVLKAHNHKMNRILQNTCVVLTHYSKGSVCGAVYQECELEGNVAPGRKGTFMSRCSSQTDGGFPAACTFYIMFSHVISI